MVPRYTLDKNAPLLMSQTYSLEKMENLPLDFSGANIFFTTNNGHVILLDLVAEIAKSLQRRDLEKSIFHESFRIVLYVS